jgi:GGDEF domain-containing protein
MKLENPPYYPYPASQVTISIGISVSGSFSNSRRKENLFETLKEQADNALYQAKMIQRQKEEMMKNVSNPNLEKKVRPIVLYRG